MRGFLTSMLTSQGLARDPSRAAALTAELAPMISSRRKLRSPILVVLPSRSLPPLECCLGVSPSQAAKSRPRRKVFASRRQRHQSRGGDRPDTRDGHPGAWRPDRPWLWRRSRDRARRSSPESPASCRRSPPAPGAPRLAARTRVSDQVDELANVARALSHYEAKLHQVAAQGVDQLSSLSDQQISRAEDHCGSLAPRRSSARQSASSAAARPRRSPPHRPCRSSAASRMASHRPAGSVGSRDPAHRSRAPSSDCWRKPPSPQHKAVGWRRTPAADLA